MKAVLLFNRDSYSRRFSHVWRDRTIRYKKSVIRNYTYYSSHRRSIHTFCISIIVNRTFGKGSVCSKSMVGK